MKTTQILPVMVLILTGCNDSAKRKAEFEAVKRECIEAIHLEAEGRKDDFGEIKERLGVLAKESAEAKDLAAKANRQIIDEVAFLVKRDFEAKFERENLAERMDAIEKSLMETRETIAPLIPKPRLAQVDDRLAQVDDGAGAQARAAEVERRKAEERKRQLAEEAENEQLAIYAAKGKSMALESFLEQGGNRQTKGNRIGGPYVYLGGPIKGLTREQAMAKFESIWASTSPEVKKLWAKRARATGTTKVDDPNAISSTEREALNRAAQRANEEIDRARTQDKLDEINRKLDGQ